MTAQVDENSIRREVFNRNYQVNVETDWYTPQGNRRSSPMYETYIENKYLGKSRKLKSKDVHELKQKALTQLNAWAEQESVARIKAANKDATQQAEDAANSAADDAKEQIEAIRNILIATLSVDDRLAWDAMVDREVFPEFAFPEPQPKHPGNPPEPGPIKPSFWEFLISSMKQTRLRQDAVNQEAWKQQCAAIQSKIEADTKAWNERRTEAWNKYWHTKTSFEEEQKQRNESLVQFRHRFEQGDPDAVIEYLKEVFERSEYPTSFYIEHTVHFDPHSQTVVVDVSLPAQSDVTDVVDYKFVKKTREAKPVSMKKKEHDALYDDAVKQCVLRTIHEVFESVYTEHVQAVVVNGWVTYLNKATGHDETSCVISVSAERKRFEEINLGKIDPTECIKSLRGLIAGPLSQVAPVQPIMKLDTEDKRFVESREVLAELHSTTNLAEIPWEEFEHLVRELFSMMFSQDGAQVKVTQASSDGGVDAIAFDPDPIRGGKFVIQAKRYTKVVPVSAVRDLYGTMISEGAVKGILVTTAHYGRDTRSFVQDKPITLIDGANLVYLLEQHGHKVRIDVEAARANRDV